MNKKFVYRANFDTWLGLILGCMLIAGSLYGWSVGVGAFGKRGPNPPIWTNWVFLFSGMGIIALSIYSLIYSKGKSTICTETDTNTDEEFAQAEAEMDALYLREYGELPEKPKPEIIESKTIEGEIAEPVKPQKGTE